MPAERAKPYAPFPETEQAARRVLSLAAAGGSVALGRAVPGGAY